MGFLDFLLGGPTTIDTMTEPQGQLNDAMATRLGREWGRGAPTYGGDMVPGPTDAHRSLFGLVPGLISGAERSPAMGTALETALSGRPAWEVDPASRERYYQEAIAAPATRDFDRRLDALDTRYGMDWTSDSGAHRGATTRAASDLSSNLAATMAGLIREDDLAARGASESAANRQLAAYGAGVGGEAQALRSAGQLADAERGIEQEQNLGDWYTWQQGQWYNNPALGFLPAAQQPRLAATTSPGLLGGMGSFLSGVGDVKGAFA